MVYKTFRLNSNKISVNNSCSVKEELKDLIPFSKFEGHYGGKVDSLEDTIGVFLIPVIYFPSSSRNQISTFKDINADLDVKIKKSDIESYFNQVSILDDIFETDLTVGTYVENRNWVLKDDKCKFLGISEDRTEIEILINETPVNVYFRTDVYIRIFKKDDVMDYLKELSKNPDKSIHIEIDRTDFKVKEIFGDNVTDNGMEEKNACEYWIYAPGEKARKWDQHYDKSIMAVGWDVGDLNEFNNADELHKVVQRYYHDGKNHRQVTNLLWDFAHTIKLGDIIFAKKGSNEIVGQGIVESDYIFDPDYTYDGEDEYMHIRKVKWIEKGNWPYKVGKSILPQKTLTNITSNDPERLKLIKGFFKNDPCKEECSGKYTKEDFLEEVYLDSEKYDVLEKLLKNKKNLIIQGPPGVGKTFLAKRLAYSLIGSKCEDRVKMVQFHQSYSYEDFVEGYRPAKEESEKDFELKYGSFYTFCKKAIVNPEKDYYFIIDEMNRGNLSKIFGELFMLIENDKRGKDNEIELLYSEKPFHIPENLYVIGLMNTADRSLAMIDYALRRRFAFFDLEPGFDSIGFNKYKDAINNNSFNNLISVVKDLNAAIVDDDETLGEGFRIGHSFFCNLKEDNIEDQLEYIVEYEIIPLLKEYWFDEKDNVKEWSNELKKSLNK